MNSDFDDEFYDDEEWVPFDSEDYKLSLRLEEAQKEIGHLEREINRLENALSEANTSKSKLTTQLYELKKLAVTMLRSIREYERTTE